MGLGGWNKLKLDFCPFRMSVVIPRVTTKIIAKKMYRKGNEEGIKTVH